MRTIIQNSIQHFIDIAVTLANIPDCIIHESLHNVQDRDNFIPLTENRLRSSERDSRQSYAHIET